MDRTASAAPPGRRCAKCRPQAKQKTIAGTSSHRLSGIHVVAEAVHPLGEEVAQLLALEALGRDEGPLNGAAKAEQNVYNIYKQGRAPKSFFFSGLLTRIY